MQIENEQGIELKNAAVMVLHDLSRDSLILTKRTSTLRHHPGEICFPGGLWETRDKDFYATALREVQEELGIEAKRITLVRKLNQERTLLGTLIHPWLASIENIEPYVQNRQEVEALIFIPMQLVVNSENYQPYVVTIRDKKIKSCIFVPHEDLVWGATARIMQQLV